MKEPVILCVDDEDIVLRSLQRELNDALDNAYMIETATGGNDALELFDDLVGEGYEMPLIISDHIMPDMKGDELLRRIHEQSPKTLKIMLTGQADMQAVTNALNSAELYRYIAKPWEKTDLVLTVKEALRCYFQEKQLAEQNIILHNMNAVLEQQVHDRTVELEVQKIELERKNTLLEEVNASKDKFFSIMAHDLRNPFTNLLGYTDLILEKFDDYQTEELKQDIRHLQHSAKHLYALLTNLLTWSRIQRGVMLYQPAAIDLSELVQNTVYLFAQQAKRKHITFTIAMNEPHLAYADYQMINTVIRNLVSNALKFTPSEGMITISANREPQQITLTVKDTGIGISDTGLNRLFRIDRHYTKPGTQGEEGTGLGLILCKELIEKNAGTLRVESTIGTGTSFAFTLPVPIS